MQRTRLRGSLTAMNLEVHACTRAEREPQRGKMFAAILRASRNPVIKLSLVPQRKLKVAGDAFWLPALWTICEGVLLGV